MSGFEGLAAAILVATVLAFVAKKTDQPTVVAYIITGMILGPVGLSMVGETEMTKTLSELGLIFLLFLIGLEIKLDEVKQILKPVTAIGLIQMALTFALGYVVGFQLGFTVTQSLFIGAASMFSSTALVVKLLTDKDEASSLPGRLNIGVLLIQDIVVIIILALISTSATGIKQVAVSLLEVGVMISVIGAFSFISSKYFLPKAFEKLSNDLSSFFIHGIAWAFLMITIAGHLNLSLEIGAFFAGLSLAQLPYSNELQERVRPLTDIFMAVFFINFGLKLMPGNLSSLLFEAVLASIALMAGKFLIFFVLTDQMKFTPETSLKSALNMTQTSEFSLILGALALSNGIIGNDIVGFISLVAIITMGASSYLLNYNQEIYNKLERFLQRFESEDKNDIKVDRLEGHALVIGYDTVSKKILEQLEQKFETVVVVDRSSENVEELSNANFEFIYGDFSHSEIRRASGASRASLIISLSPDFQVNREILEYKNRDSTFFVKAQNIEDAGELYEMGAHYVILKNILTGEKMNDYVKLYLEDRELFQKEVRPEIDRILYGGREDV